MGLTKYKLGGLIEMTDERNYSGRYSLDSVKGISTEKVFIDTKANMDGVSLDSYKVVNPCEFSYVPDTSRRGDKIALAFNNSTEPVLISSIYSTFRISHNDLLLPEFLYMFFNRPEFDRYSRFNSWGSARETFSWEDFCNIDITLPSIEQQRKYVDVYLALQKNLAAYQSKVDELKLVCDGYIEKLRKTVEPEEIGPYIRGIDERNDGLSITLTQGVDVNLQFIPAKREAEDQEGTKIVRTGQFAFNKVVKSNGTKLPIALREGPDCVISSSYEVFEVIDKDVLYPVYLMLWMSRSETHRQCGFKSYGTTRDVFPYEELRKLKFPIPSINIQKTIANIYSCYKERQRIAAQLKEQLNNLCPILIKGSLQNL
jgi:type I restriction enzyme S subunit